MISTHDAPPVKRPPKELSTAVVRFAGDSGDGMQVVGDRFSDSSAIAGHDICTFPDYPAEIRAPVGTLPGVSAFQIHFGGNEVMTPGDEPNALVAMNPAALKMNLPDLAPKGLLVVNTSQFTEGNLKKARYETSPLDDPALDANYQVIRVDLSGLTETALKDSGLKRADKVRCKNFFALGMIYWTYDRSLESTLEWINAKWASKPQVAQANGEVLKAGYYFGETSELIGDRFTVQRAKIPKGLYRKISGNEALAIGLVAASHCSQTDIVYGSYPITPASDILKYLSAYKNYNVKTVQAEDEIAAIGVALGASFAGALGVTGTSGPGLCLKSEALGFAVMTELPLVVVNVQRGGPSTGLPTKVEQADLLQAMFGRNGESPVAIVAASSPSDCFDTAIEAARIALTYNTPVILMSDSYIAMGSEPWRIPAVNDLDEIRVRHVLPTKPRKVYERDEDTLARQLAIPGTPQLEHQIGGLEKNEEGSVSYDPENHERMVGLRIAKVGRIARTLPPTEIMGNPQGKVLVLGWGSTRGAIVSAVKRLQEQGSSVSCVHLRYLNPLPQDLGEILSRFKTVLMPEMNMGQLNMMIRSRYLIDTVSYTRVRGRPFLIRDLVDRIETLL
ncbi:MAG: 2-oxoacid:acceptor oxidoreductase subunit alpha [Planctomycetes bacterium]|nr:2-oxoacid:acceptor oxidoreductase subunit alpha [Planctomycetota bacterium]